MATMAIRALLFDFDGLIVDTETPVFASWREVYVGFGVELALSDWSAAIGTADGFDPIKHLEGLVGRELDGDDIRRRRYARKMELSHAEDLRPGVESFIARAGELGLAVAIVSSDTRAWIMSHLDRLGFASHWHSIHCAEMDPTVAKPRPDTYLAALASLELTPDEAIAFEDSPNGIAAAKAAGLFCVAVPNPTTQVLDLSQADVSVDSLEALSLDDLLGRVGTTRGRHA
jgi:HAD superfamily hydrolase (TIGR01509 family)